MSQLQRIDSLMFVRSRQHAQRVAQVIRAADQPLDLGMRFPPDRISFGQQRTTRRRQSKSPAAAVLFVDRDFQQPASFERLKIGRESGAIHRKERGNAAECRWLRAIERHQQRELTAGEIERTQHVVEATRQCARSTVHVQAQAAVPHQMGGGERQLNIFGAGV